MGSQLLVAQATNMITDQEDFESIGMDEEATRPDVVKVFEDGSAAGNEDDCFTERHTIVPSHSCYWDPNFFRKFI